MYTREELWALRRYDVTPSRPSRKIIFRYRLWRPYRQRRRTRYHGFTSRDGLSRTISTNSRPLGTQVSCLRFSAYGRDRDTQSTVVFGCLNIRSLLNKFDDVIELCRNCHIDVLCLTETWHDAASAVLGRLRRLDITLSTALVLALLMTCLSTTAASLLSLRPTLFCHRSPSLISQLRSSWSASELCLANSQPSLLLSTDLD